MAAGSPHHGWLVSAGPIFARRVRELRGDVARLKESLSPDEFCRHPTVKLYVAVQRLTQDIVPRDPDAPSYRLRGDLARFRRVKKLGLPPRYRLFFIFSSRARSIVFLYLNDERTIRKEGDKNDVYEVFRRMVRRGEIGEDFDANLRMLDVDEEAL